MSQTIGIYLRIATPDEEAPGRVIGMHRERAHPAAPIEGIAHFAALVALLHPVDAAALKAALVAGGY